jgi:hypothetical protein
MKDEPWQIYELKAFGYLDRLIKEGLEAGKAVRVSCYVRWTTAAYVIEEILNSQGVSCSPNRRSHLVSVGRSLRRLGLCKRHQFRLKDGSVVRPWVILEASESRR